MLETAGTFITGAISAIGDLLDPSNAVGSTSAAVGWAALLALSVSGAVIGSAVALLKKFSRRK